MKFAIVLALLPLAGWAASPMCLAQATAMDRVRPRGGTEFAALKSVARSARHLVFEPNPSVTEASLRKGLAHIRNLWAS